MNFKEVNLCTKVCNIGLFHGLFAYLSMCTWIIKTIIKQWFNHNKQQTDINVYFRVTFTWHNYLILYLPWSWVYSQIRNVVEEFDWNCLEHQEYPMERILELSLSLKQIINTGEPHQYVQVKPTHIYVRTLYVLPVMGYIRTISMSSKWQLITRHKHKVCTRSEHSRINGVIYCEHNKSLYFLIFSITALAWYCDKYKCYMVKISQDLFIVRHLLLEYIHRTLLRNIVMCNVCVCICQTLFTIFKIAE